VLNSNIIFVNQLKKFAIEVKTEIGVLASENSTSKFGSQASITMERNGTA
jgi:hypothetical protein